MSIALTTPETYPQSSEVRLVGIGARVDKHVLTLVIDIGSTQAGSFITAREIQLRFDDTSSPTFSNVVSNVPEFRNLKLAIETYLTNQLIFVGTAT